MSIVIRGICLAILYGFLFSIPALAHARYLRSEPGEGAIVSTAPLRVELWFSQELFRRQEENWINVFDSNGAEVHEGQAQIDDDDRSHLWVNLKDDLLAGEYLVEWQNLSAEDGDSDEGSFLFYLDLHTIETITPMRIEPSATSPAASNPTASLTKEYQPSSTSRSNEGNQPAWGPACGFAFVPLIVLAGIALIPRRK